VVIELWAVEAFCLTPVIVCLFFVASVVYVGDTNVSLRLLLFVSSLWLVLSMLEMQVSPYACFVCLFFVASVVYVGDASVSLSLLLFVSSSWLVLSMLEMKLSPYAWYCLSLLHG
jgi:hypothetical protein